MHVGGSDQMAVLHTSTPGWGWLRQHEPIISSATRPRASRLSPLLLPLMCPHRFHLLALGDLQNQLALLLCKSSSFCPLLGGPSLKRH